MRLVVDLTKYMLVLLMGIYTYFSFNVFRQKNRSKQERCYTVLTIVTFIIHFIGYFTLYLETLSDKLLLLYFSEVIMFLLILILYQLIYPKLSKLLLHNMLLLLSVGFIMLARLSYDKAVRQVMIVGVASLLCLIVPYVIKSFDWLKKYGWVYGAIGIVLLVIVLVAGTTTYGAKNWIQIGGFSFQPSEFVKILYVFSIAAMFNEGTDFRRVCAITVMAASNVLILVVQKDLGGALIFFVCYVFMLYIATTNPFYLLAGLSGGSVAAVIAYKFFYHVRVRVIAWQDPFKYIDKEGYQISQSLFAIGTGGWFGMGLLQGLPTSIPVVDSDFIFSAISEEMGGLFALCLVLIYLNCFIMLINIALKMTDNFYRLLSVGFAIMFGFQVFLSIGGVIKFIPSTGVTLPFISSGGSSIFVTILMFMILQGIYLKGQLPVKRADRSQV